MALFGLPLESREGLLMNTAVFESVYHSALEESCARAVHFGPYPAWYTSPSATGQLYVDMWPTQSHGDEDFTTLRAEIMRHGIRNSTLTCQPSRAYFPTLQDEGSGAEPYIRYNVT